jgi:thermosome
VLSGQPIIILKDNVERTRGQEAQRSNIAAAKAIAAAVRTTLGPRGMDKMLVSSTGDVVITNDGVTILSEMSVQHPGAKMVIEVAETQDDEVGDGTTTACILVGSLMEQAELMLAKMVHPTVIANGYTLAMDRALEIVDENSIRVDPADRATLIKIADTSMTGKSIEQVKEKLNGIVVDAVMTIAESKNGGLIVDRSDIMIKKQKGEAMDDAALIKGIVIDKTRASESMPKRIANAKVALVAQPLEITKTQVKAKIKINTADQLNAFGAQERETLKALADAIVATGANVLLCQKGISDPVQYYLAKAGVLAIQDVPEKDLKYAARALSARIVNKVTDLTAEDLGNAALVEEADDADLVTFSGCENPKAITILLRGSTDYRIDEIERAVIDGTSVVADAMEDGTFVVGGGAVEIELSLRLREYAASVGGRVQLAIDAFATAFESVPLTLAENSGFNPLDKLVDLRTAHAKGGKHMGLNVFSGQVVDMFEAGVIEPARVKRQAIQSAAETAVLLIRVDDMMITQTKAPGMPGGM